MTIMARALSPAKVNLHLEIYPKRDDGFHGLVSVFQMVSLYDEITIRSLTDEEVRAGGDCLIEGDFNFPAEENIIGKCCGIFRKETALKTGLAFRVRKRIPQGSGLGGGSSNGGAVLRALNTVFGTGIPDERLAGMGAMVGSDIPFFCKAPAAIGSGRGECVSPLRAREDFFLVLVVPPLHINTSAAYGWLDADGEFAAPSRGREDALRRIYEEGILENWKFFNSFYPVLRKREPVFEEIRAGLLDAGAFYATISGSGSAMFGLFRDKNSAQTAEKLLKQRYAAVKFLEPLAGMPSLVLQ
jgi:4-diphosphocytidyl-2-C-methyl-D-erythritol kinase